MRVAVTILNGGTVSSAADCGPENQFYGVEMPGTWTAGNITFQVSNDGTNYMALVDDGGTAVTLTSPAANQTVLFRSTIVEALAQFRFIKLVSQNAQGADRALFCLVRLTSA